MALLIPPRVRMEVEFNPDTFTLTETISTRHVIGRRVSFHLPLLEFYYDGHWVVPEQAYRDVLYTRHVGLARPSTFEYSFGELRDDYDTENITKVRWTREVSVGRDGRRISLGSEMELEKNDTPTSNEETGMIVTIIDIESDSAAVPNLDISHRTMTVETPRGIAQFNHLGLKELNVEVGDVVRIFTTGLWMESDPPLLVVLDWELVEVRQNENNSYPEEAGIIVKILEILDTPNESNHTILVETERGTAFFNHLNLQPLDISVGDEIRIWTTELWI